MDLRDVLAPLEMEEFIERRLGCQMSLVRRAPGRFAHLLPWGALNQTLSQIRVTGDRLRLVQHGKALARKSYLDLADSNQGSPLKAAVFERCLADGATLVLNAVDELFPPIRELADEFEKIFRVRTQMNLYAGWRAQHGFDLHYDDHDTVILQVHGCKHWKVYEPTRMHPLAKDKDIESAPEPTTAPVWDGILEDGGMLYMPRGWWHVACPLDEPSLHLTVGLSHPTGTHLLAWLVNQLKATVEARMDVPHLKTADEQTAWLAALRAHLIDAWDSRMLDRFMTFWDGRAVARPDVHLPDTAARDVALTSDTRLRLAKGRRLSFSSADASGTVRFVVDGNPWTCAATLVPALERLHHIRYCAVREMRALIPSAAGPSLTLFLSAMVMGGLVSVQPAPGAQLSDSRLIAPESRPRTRDRAVAQHP
jgi:ribosomal protein L16 Arg81 hydroxylase